VRTRFGTFTLDSGTRQLLDDDGREIHLSPKAFDVLTALAGERPKVVNKADLHDRIWPGTFVVDANLNVLVGEIRKALGDSAQEPRFIRTVHKVGYAFCAQASDAPATGRVAAREPVANGVRCWLAWNERTFALGPGENVIGRDPACTVWLDASGVSRKHARVRVIDGEPATLEDLGSTNGTFVGDAPVTSATSLADGDVVHIGSVTLTFRAWLPGQARATERIKR
jgi:DNA-binding winged helix-turn-helix (wHTH) protein